jgi:diguanylate cyclase
MPLGSARFSTFKRVMTIFAVVLVGVEGIVVAYYWQYGLERLKFELMISAAITTAVGIPVIAHVILQYAKLQQLTNRLAHLASVDQMTDLLNRQTFLERLDSLLAATSKTASAGVFAYIDADYFKALNDRFGHMIGDRVIVLLAGHIKQAAREGDLCARLGGEEFALFLRGANLTRATMVAGRLRRDIELSGIKLGIPGLTLSVSIGLAAHKPGAGALATMQDADRSMYAAKDGGRNVVVAELRRNRVA